ncbi:MAG: HD domain-containing phosphohydrolase [Chthonomonadales bacterium]
MPEVTRSRQPVGEHSKAHRSAALSILVVDDDDAVRDLLATALGELGYRVRTASNAEDGIIRLLWEPFDLVLCDVVLPGMDGIGFARNVSQAHPGLPIVLITGYGGSGLARTALRDGAADVISKPISIRELPVMIERNVERSRLERARHSNEGQRVMSQSIRALAAAIDAKEAYTAEHSRRVAALAAPVGASLGLPASEITCLEFAALVHDVGKIAVPDGILNKPGALTAEEWEIMRRHPSKGAEILNHVHELAYVANVVRHHHERPDGSGYPDGLRGEAIPLLSRIIAVADAYEVMTSDRVYRARRSPETAASELRNCAGTQFDGTVVETFCSLLKGGVVQ